MKSEPDCRGQGVLNFLKFLSDSFNVQVTPANHLMTVFPITYTFPTLANVIKPLVCALFHKFPRGTCSLLANKIIREY